MVQKKARTKDYTPEERVAIILEGQGNKETVAAVARKYGISRETYYTWQREHQTAIQALWQEQPAGRKPKGHLDDLNAAAERIKALEAENAALAAEKKALEKQFALTDLRLLNCKIILNRVPDELKKNLAYPWRKKSSSKRPGQSPGPGYHRRRRPLL
ncbi:transposase [Moorella sp. Hama-1]|uniref:transposase n=1 Tax=Moorella sp. Hama-1 TaxID=2138101 RepID=UPI000D64C1AC|nr:transposase [Moorella sp. Hama-1]BCV22674.1 hypothetical protein hamaS1_27430 [Moorella sp. Hama-1]